MTGKFIFSKNERLCHKKQIDRLFSDGKSFTLDPLKVYYLLQEVNDNQPAQVLIAIPRKKFRRAVDRNHLKRLIREAYRLNKHRLAGVPANLHLGFVYIGHDAVLPFAEMEIRMIACLGGLMKALKLNPDERS
jgi:ribonuclease P protein component